MTTINAQTTFSSSTSSSTLDRNLKALESSAPLLIDPIRAASPAADLKFLPTDEPGALSAIYQGRSLASRRAPLVEAERLAQSVDPKDAGAVVVLGFGLGHHVKALFERCQLESLIIVFEPDVSLLRSVLSKIDHSHWLSQGNVLIVTDPDDTASLTVSLRNTQGLMSFGVRIIEHLPSKRRLDNTGKRFCDSFSKILAAARTMVVTTLVQAETTCRNFLNNSKAYIANPGILDLVNTCAARPAITVAAGPSLARNIDLLSTPGLRDRCVIIAAQTVLKPLLAKGIQPHFVTSLDFHEISARFYENLTADDVANTTLVVEPKANPAIVRAYPGPIRMPAEVTLDLLFGPEIAGEHGAIRAGSTVAHLSYYFARLLGCDPVILVGQDLGFTDGLYYADGATIHQVWRNELNPFRTLEMLEWERIARHRSSLRKVKDTTGGEIYTDEQMATYIAQFDQHFLEDSRAGKTTIDATEGGAVKANTTIQTLADAIAQYAPPDSPPLPDLSPPAAEEDANERLALGLNRLGSVRKDTVKLISLSRKTAHLLGDMIDADGDQKAINKLIRKTYKLRDEATALQPAFALVHRINQMGAFKRARADRAIHLTDDLSPVEIQKRQIARDKINVEWIADAGESLVNLFDQAWDDDTPNKKKSTKPTEIALPGAYKPSQARKLVSAVIPVDFDRSTLGYSRDLSKPIAGLNPLGRTLRRLSHCQRINSAILLTTDIDHAKQLVGDPPEHFSISYEQVQPQDLHDPAIAAARLFARSSWRGALGGLSCLDEVAPIKAIASALDRADRLAALIVGADWSLVDAKLCDDVIDRWLDAPESSRVAFTQAPPGLVGAVVSKELASELAQLGGSTLNTIGGLLSYHPQRAKPDPIAGHACPPIDHTIRDAPFRFIADNTWTSDLIAKLGDRALDAIAKEIVDAARTLGQSAAPDHLIIELAAGAPPHGCAPPWTADRSAPHQLMPRNVAETILRTAAENRPDLAVTFTGAGDPLTCTYLFDLIHFAKEIGIAGVHVRTPLVAPSKQIDALSEAPVDIISVDLLANSAATYTSLLGADHFAHVIENINQLATSRTPPTGLPTPWIVPRITRCQAALSEIEAFYDKWIYLLGAAMIDPLPIGAHTGRIAPLTLPEQTRRRFETTTAFFPCSSSASNAAPKAAAP